MIFESSSPRHPKLLCHFGIHDWRRREETIDGIQRRIMICELCKKQHFIEEIYARIVIRPLGLFIGRITFDRS